MSRILVVEDDYAFRSIIRDAVEEAGHEAAEADNGNTAMERVREEAIDLVITDIVMPEREGLETIRDLKRDFPEIPVIAISGGGAIDGETYLDLAKRFGADKIFCKPFDLGELMGAVEELLSEEKV